MLENKILLERLSPSSSANTFYGSASSSNVSFPPNPLHTISNMRTRTKQYFTILVIINNLTGVGWLVVSIWIGATFAENFNYDPEFLLSFMPVFLVTTVGLLIENLPILIILRSLRNESNIPLPMIRAETVFMVVNVFYIAAPVALTAALFERIEYGPLTGSSCANACVDADSRECVAMCAYAELRGCAHACAGEEFRASAPLVAAVVHLVAFVFRLGGLLGAVQVNQYNN